MKILIGTTNPSKIRRFEELLAGCGIAFFTLHDFQIADEPAETGRTPVENAVIKARFYGRYFDTVICNDSGLYFDELPLDDTRQPGLNIRTPGGGNRLDDGQMIEYYAALIRSLGGRVLAYYSDGIAVWRRGQIQTFAEDRESARTHAFYMVDRPSAVRREGWPLDSLSLNRKTMTYFTDQGNQTLEVTEDNVISGEYRNRVIAFLKDALGLTTA